MQPASYERQVNPTLSLQTLRKAQVRTMRKTQFWKRYARAIALLILPALGKADVILDWNAIMQATVSRAAAISAGAIRGHYATGGIRGSQLDYPRLPAIPRDHHARRRGLRLKRRRSPPPIPCSGFISRPARSSLDAARATSLAAIPDSTAKNDGIAVGEAAAAAMIAARANDGSSPPAFYLPSSTNPGEWQLTPSCTAAGGAFFHWQNVTPFGIRSASQFRLDPPPELAGGSYTRRTTK